MNTNQITILVAIIAAGSAIISAIIASIITYKLNLSDTQHKKQWAYVDKITSLVDNGIEIFTKMLFNKLLIAYSVDVETASNNLFLLQRDILVIESQLVVYGSLELADVVYSFKNLIVQTPNEDFLKKWGEIYQEGNRLLLLFRKELGEKLSEKFADFAKDLTQIPPSLPSGSKIEAKEIGSTGSFLETKVVNS